MSAAEKIYTKLVDRDAETEATLPTEARDKVASNGVRLVSGLALQSSGDQTMNASTVLPWLFHALGVPAGLVGLLVPIRESGSMLPQAFLTPWVVRVARRTWVFVLGALVQALCVAIMAATAALGSGLSAGVTILVALALFSLGRCLNSISSKDVLGRTVPKGQRGQINGLSTTTAGLVAITLGVAIRVLGGEDVGAGVLAILLAFGSLLYVGAAAVYARVDEPLDESDTEASSDGSSWWRDTLGLLRRDAQLRNFVTVRSFLLVSSLSPPFIVSIAAGAGTTELAGIGGFVLASGVAALLGGRIFGRLADRSSRKLMVLMAALASLILLVLVALVTLPAFDGVFEGEGAVGTLVFVGAYFLVALVHTGVRVARKTYVVDIAEGDLRTTYVAVSNTAMGIILLVVGALSAAIAGATSAIGALLFLAAMGIVGVLLGLRLPEA